LVHIQTENLSPHKVNKVSIYVVLHLTIADTQQYSTVPAEDLLLPENYTSILLNQIV